MSPRRARVLTLGVIGAALAVMLAGGCAPVTAPGVDGGPHSPAPAPPALGFDPGESFATLGAQATARTVSAGGVLGDDSSPSAAPPCSSFVRAATQVGAWGAAIGSAVVLPLLLTAVAVSGEPSYAWSPSTGESYTWTRSSTVTDSLGVSHTYGATLTAVLHQGAVRWSLHVSGVAPSGHTLSNFEWYTGEMQADAASGSWQFRDPRLPATPTPLLRITWARGAGASSVTFLRQRAGLAAGDSLRYALAGPTASFDMWSAASATRTLTVADTATWAGSVTRTPGGRTCWDSRAHGFACVPCDVASMSPRLTRP